MNETNEERLKRADEFLKDLSQAGDGVGLHGRDVELVAWLIVQAGRAQELEKDKMRLRRALKHITVFPTHFTHERHSIRALKISRKALKR